ncbi:MAG: VCBS repeat-containing protein [Verrucomicrobia bacterium]|nr:VCBS repeat-containing protein [Verrucomicrobiota bacterium]
MNIRKFILLGFLGLLLAPGIVEAQSSPHVLWKRTLNSDRVNAIIFNTAGDTVISGSSDRLINFWRASDGMLLRTLNANAPYVHESAIESLSMPLDGSRLASATYLVVKLWTLPEGSVKDLTGHTDWVVGVSFSPNGQFLASASFDSTVKIWRGTDGVLLRTLPLPRMGRCVAFSPDGTLLAIGAGSGQLYIYRTSDWTQVFSLAGHTDDLYSISVSPDGTMLATGAYDRTARVWSLANGALLQTFNGDGHVYGVAFTPDSKELAFSDGQGDSIRVHRISDGVRTRFYTVETPEVQCVAISKDGLMAYGRVDRTVVLASFDTSVTPPPPPPVEPPPPPPPTNDGWSLSASVNGNGRITFTPEPNGPNGKFLPGTMVQLRAIPDGTNTFIRWTGSATGSTLTISITMDADKSLVAHFTEANQPAAIMMNDSRQLVAWFIDGPRLLDTTLVRDGRVLGKQWRIAAFADLNHDGTKDYIFQDSDGRVATWFMNGSTFQSSAWLRNGHAIAPSWKAVAAADMNQDGEVDIIFQNMLDGRLVVWLMNGTEFLRAVVLRDGKPGAPGWRIKATADINRDGHPDLIWHNVNTGACNIWLMQGTNVVSGHKVRDGASLGAKWRIVAMKDFNRDGNPDILWQHILDGRMVVWLMDHENYVGTLLLENGLTAPSRILGIK